MSPADHSQSDDKAERALAKKILLVLLVVVVAWGGAIYQWGVPGLYIPALATVPLIYGLLIWVAKG